MRCLGSPQTQRMQRTARAGQLEGPWGVWRQAVKVPVAGWGGRALCLGYSLVLKVWPTRSLLTVCFIWTTADTSCGN